MENEDLTIVIPSDKENIEHTVLTVFEIDNNNYIAVVPNSDKSPEILLIYCLIYLIFNFLWYD